MSLFEMAAGSRYVKIAFDAEELSVIRAACASVSAVVQERMGDIADASLEQAAGQAKRTSDFLMADGLVSMFKAGQEVLIEPEDLALVLDSMKAYGQSAPEEHMPAVMGIVEKIELSSQR